MAEHLELLALPRRTRDVQRIRQCPVMLAAQRHFGDLQRSGHANLLDLASFGELSL